MDGEMALKIPLNVPLSSFTRLSQFLFNPRYDAEQQKLHYYNNCKSFEGGLVKGC